MSLMLMHQRSVNVDLMSHGIRPPIHLLDDVSRPASIPPRSGPLYNLVRDPVSWLRRLIATQGRYD